MEDFKVGRVRLTNGALPGVNLSDLDPEIQTIIKTQPELLEACKDFLENWATRGGTHRTRIEIRMAEVIAKAEGR